MCVQYKESNSYKIIMEYNVWHLQKVILWWLGYSGRYLLTDQNRLRSVNDIMPMIGARFYTQLDAAQMRNDVIEEDLAKVNHVQIPAERPIVSIPRAVP